MNGTIVMWSGVPQERRLTGRLPGGWAPSTWRGCEAAVQHTGEAGYRRCAGNAIKHLALCRKHAERSGAIEPGAEVVEGRSEYPRGVPNRVGNVIRRHVQRVMRKDINSTPTVAEFRALSDTDVLSMRNAGRASLAMIRRVRDTWTDEELIAAFDLRASEYADSPAAFGLSNWVGEAVYA